MSKITVINGDKKYFEERFIPSKAVSFCTKVTDYENLFFESRFRLNSSKNLGDVDEHAVLENKYHLPISHIWDKQKRNLFPEPCSFQLKYVEGRRESKGSGKNCCVLFETHDT